MGALNPTDEQQVVLQRAERGATLKIKAYAGAGKTSTLKMLADRRTHLRGRFLAFNKAIAESAKAKFPKSVQCSTWHSLAYRQVDPYLTQKLDQPKERPQDLASRYGLGPMRLPSIMGKTVELSAYQLGAIIADSTGRFCRSAQKEPDTRHIQVSDMLDDKAADEFKAFLLPHVKRHWEECLSRDSRAGVSPDAYLKVWELSQPIIHADYIMTDELPE